MSSDEYAYKWAEKSLNDLKWALTHFMSLVCFYTPWKRQKTSGFLMFSGGIERDSSMKWVNELKY